MKEDVNIDYVVSMSYLFPWLAVSAQLKMFTWLQVLFTAHQGPGVLLALLCIPRS